MLFFPFTAQTWKLSIRGFIVGSVQSKTALLKRLWIQAQSVILKNLSYLCGLRKNISLNVSPFRPTAPCAPQGTSALGIAPWFCGKGSMARCLSAPLLQHGDGSGPPCSRREITGLQADVGQLPRRPSAPSQSSGMHCLACPLPQLWWLGQKWQLLG